MACIFEIYLNSSLSKDQVSILDSFISICVFLPVSPFVRCAIVSFPSFSFPFTIIFLCIRRLLPHLPILRPTPLSVISFTTETTSTLGRTKPKLTISLSPTVYS